MKLKNAGEGKSSETLLGKRPTGGGFKIALKLTGAASVGKSNRSLDLPRTYTLKYVKRHLNYDVSIALANHQSCQRRNVLSLTYLAECKRRRIPFSEGLRRWKFPACLHRLAEP